jgi:hypothetical protein
MSTLRLNFLSFLKVNVIAAICHRTRKPCHHGLRRGRVQGGAPTTPGPTDWVWEEVFDFVSWRSVVGRGVCVLLTGVFSAGCACTWLRCVDEQALCSTGGSIDQALDQVSKMFVSGCFWVSGGGFPGLVTCGCARVGAWHRVRAVGRKRTLAPESNNNKCPESTYT